MSLAAFGQATIFENQSVKVLVDASAGSDSNSGVDQPVRTITRGVAVANQYAAKNVGVKVLIQPGTYRETVTVGWARYNPTLTIQAAQPGTVVISGADVFQNWQSNGTTYSHSFAGVQKYYPPTNWNLGAINPIMWRREMVFVNGMQLAQVMAASQLQPGTFYVADSSQQLEVYPLANTDMSTAVVEVATRANTIKLSSRNNVVLRGLICEYAASKFDENGVDIDSASNILVDSVQSNWNNFGGLHVGGTHNVTIKNSVASHNGGVGMNATRSNSGLFEFNETDYNNWRGEQAAFYDWGMGGFKFFTSHGNVVQDHFSYNNGGQGLWFDTDNRQIWVQNATLSGNNVTNLQIELNYGPVEIDNSTICYGTTGTNLINSEQVTYFNNTFYGNGGNGKHYEPQFYLQGKQGGRSFIDYETHVYHNVVSQKVNFSGNTVVDSAPNQEAFYSYFTGSDWYTFRNSFKAISNQYFDALNPKIFYSVVGGKESLGAWQNTMGQDWSSLWGMPANMSVAGCVAPTPSAAEADFFVSLDAPAYRASNGSVTLSIQEKKYGSMEPVTYSVHGLPSSVTRSFGAQTAATHGASTMGLTLKSYSYRGTVPVMIYARSGNHVHTVFTKVTF